MEPQKALCGSVGRQSALGQGLGHVCLAPLKEDRKAGGTGVQGARGRW